MSSRILRHRHHLHLERTPSGDFVCALLQAVTSCEMFTRPPKVQGRMDLAAAWSVERHANGKPRLDQVPCWCTHGTERRDTIDRTEEFEFTLRNNRERAMMGMGSELADTKWQDVSLIEEDNYVDLQVDGTGWPASPGPFFVSQKSEWLPFWPLFGRNGPLWEVREIEISIREPDFEPFSWFETPFWRVKKQSKCQHSKSHMNHAVDRPKKHVV